MHRVLVWPLVLVACTTRPLDDGATDSASTGSTGSPPATSGMTGAPTTGAPTTGPMTTEPATSGLTSTTDPGTSTTTTTMTTEPLTSGPSSTVTTDVSTSGDPSGTTDTSGDRLDLPPPPDDSSLVGCTQDAPPGTVVAGMTVQGPFAADRAYFGRRHFDGELVMPVFMFLSPEAQTFELWEQDGNSGDIIHGTALTEPFNAWIGDWTFDGVVVTNNGVNDPVAIEVEITGFAGNWDAPDPNDPPRLVGTLSGEVAGPFDAVFCDNLNIIPPP